MADDPIELTKRWLEKIVIGLHLCPFASAPFYKEKIRYRLLSNNQPAAVASELIASFKELDSTADIETTLIVLEEPISFENYLDLVYLAEELIENLELSGVFQIASFHPKYCFDASEPDDRENFTNRSPYALLHIIRESSINELVDKGVQLEQIATKNINTMRKLSKEYFKELFSEFTTRS